MNFHGQNVDVRRIIEALGLEITGETGKEILVNCLWHGDRGSNLSINRENGLYQCWVCGHSDINARGDIVSFVSRVHSVTRSDAIEYIVRHSTQFTAQQLMHDLQRMLRTKKKPKPQEIDISGYINPYHPYWRSRGIDIWTANKFQLGFDERRQHAIIPITVEGRSIATIRRRLMDDGPRYTYSKDFNRNDVLFGLDQCRGTGLYIVEGAIDCIKVHQAGYNAVAVLGGSISLQQRTLIREYGPEHVVIMSDEDLGGQILANQIVREMSDMPLYYTLLPNGKKDPGACTTYEIWEAINKKNSVITAYLQQKGQLQPRRSIR